MPASMITACVALSPKVTGSRIEMPDSGPMPGNTPTNVPTRQPRKAYQRLSGWKAMAKPCARLRRVVSTNAILEAELWKRRFQAVDERDISKRDDRDRINGRAQRLSPLDHQQQGHHHQQHGEKE